MLTAIETQHRRAKLNRKTTSTLSVTSQSELDNNNSAQNKNKIKIKTPIQPKAVPAKKSGSAKQEVAKDEKKKPKKEKKKFGKFSVSLPSGVPKIIKIKGPGLGHKKKENLNKKPQVKPAEPFIEVIGKEEVVVNRVHLYDEEAEKNIQLKSPGPKTPENYGRSVEFYRHINEARATYVGAAARCGIQLLTGRVVGDIDDWEKYCSEKKEREIQWRRECRERDNAREKESRKVDEGKGTCCFAVGRCGQWVKAQFKDIFPCCLPE
ncbi:uncharacterized protein [Haliotis cracherodii]|uniref:uncharacterized protein n=1 Tax=Haliotis cracherodii TaxID=6455 RepID=UPI0039E9D2DF